MRLPAQSFHGLKELLSPANPDPALQLFRLKSVERDVILPIKALYAAILVYYFYWSRGMANRPRRFSSRSPLPGSFWSFIWPLTSWWRWCCSGSGSSR